MSFRNTLSKVFRLYWIFTTLKPCPLKAKSTSTSFSNHYADIKATLKIDRTLYKYDILFLIQCLFISVIKLILKSVKRYQKPQFTLQAGNPQELITVCNLKAEAEFVVPSNRRRNNVFNLAVAWNCFGFISKIPLLHTDWVILSNLSCVVALCCKR